MNQVSALKRPSYLEFQHPFLQELIDQFRLIDTFSKYRDWSDQQLIKHFTSASIPETAYSNLLYLTPLNQLLTQAFYHAVGVIVKRITGHTTETFVHFKGKEFSSAVIFCGGVLVVYSLLWSHSLNFISLQDLLETSQRSIDEAITKAHLYLDFVD